ncbi:MAG: hypothetical protein IPJ01_11095 [Micavibrio sp.]|nr:hypothetical protein [Micavibrio sp.]
MEMRNRHYESAKSKAERIAYIFPIDELLFKERKGKFLTPEEKKRLKKYAEEQRKKKQSKK